MTSRRVQVSVSKEAPDELVGIRFRLQDSDDAMVIHTISATSLFANTDLQVGMIVESINDVEAEGLSLKLVMNLLRDSEDVVTIAARCPARETASNEEVGTSQPPQTAAVESSITEIQDATLIVVPQDGVETADASQVGGYPIVECEEVNAVPTRSSATLEPNVTQVITAVATKSACNPSSGLVLRDHPIAGVLISNIKSSSIFYGTELHVGLKLLSINDTDCRFLRKEAAAALLKSSTGRLTIRATEVDAVSTATPEIKRDQVVTVMVRKSIRGPTGLKLRDDPSRGVLISRITPTSIFRRSALRRGMKLLSISGTDCRFLHKESVADILAGCVGDVTVRAAGTRLVSTNTLEVDQVVMAVARKRTRGSTVGLMLRDHPDGGVLINSVRPSSIFYSSALHGGLKFLSINNTDCEFLKKESVADILMSSMGQITIRALRVDPSVFDSATSTSTPAICHC